MASRKVPQNAQQVGPAKDASSPNKTRKKSSGKAQAEADDSPKTPTQVKRTSPRKSEAPPVSLQSTQQKRPAPTSSEPDQRVTKKRNVSESLGDTQAALHGFQVLMEMYQVKDECLETSEKQRVKAMSICEAQGKAIVEKDKKIEQLQLAAVNARAYCEEIEEENEHFQNEMHQLQREKDCLQDEKEQKTTILTICNKRLAELRAKNKEIEEANEELGKEVRDYRDLVAEYEQKLAKHEIAYDAVTNDEIHRLWWQLHNIMYSMVIALFNVDPTPNAFPDCKHRDSVIQLAKDCVDHSSLRPLVLQQFIWSRLLEDVFCGGVGVWGGELGQHLVGMTKEFADQCALNPSNGPTLSDAKYRCIHKLSNILEIKEEAIRQIVDDLKEKLSCFMTDGSHNEADKHLVKVVRKAVDIHIILMKSKSLFRFISMEPFPDRVRRASIDHEAMSVWDLNRGTESGKLYFVSTPALEKFGHTHGYRDSFAERTIVIQSRVMAD